MKKIIMLLALVGIMLTANSCKKNDASNVKIDFTQSYEDAALALLTAQKNYDEAVATNDPLKIKSAKKELQAAQEKYLESKKIYVAEGGTVKSQYESYLVTSARTLGIQRPDSVSNVVKKYDSIITGKTNAKIENTANEVKAKVNAEKGKLVEDANNRVSNAKNTAEKTKADIKKSAEEKINIAKQDLNSLFEQK
ncbi:hypothetical protein ACFX5F_01945 [Flavobacterium sp. ZS1P70]|uniref:DUF4398 domain-containing protein n=1 Tax=Flavobacterium zhoui TaxID=3230414 RepID=A0ABW6I2Z4_9FLAO